jgi:hypothetical protein
LEDEQKGLNKEAGAEDSPTNMSDFSTGYGTHSQVFHCIVKLTNVWQTGAMKHATPRYQRYRIPAAMPVWSKNSKPPFQPGNRGWITKVYASSWRTSQNKKLSHHPQGDHEFFDFTMHTNLPRLFCALLPFLG